MAEQPTEWFRGTGSWIWGILAFVVAALIIVLDLVGGGDLAVVAAALLFALLAYVAVLRPRVGVQGGDLVLHHMYSTQRLPVAAVETVTVRRTFQATAGGRRYVSAAVSRSMRGALRRGDRDPARNYADFVEDRVLHHAAEARDLAGIPARSDQQRALADDVRRTWAWPWLAATGVLVVALVVTIAS